MKAARLYVLLASLTLLVSFLAATCYAEDFKVGIMQAVAGDARKYQPLLDYMASKGVKASFVTAQDYEAAARMFAAGSLDAMFSGSGVAGTLIIKGVAEPAVRPVSSDGFTTYWAVVIAPKGAPEFAGSADYFKGRKVVFSKLASAGEFYFHSLGPSQASELMDASSHGAALDVLARGVADVAIVKNRVWDKEKGKYPNLGQVGSDKGENPDNTLMVSTGADRNTVEKIRGILLGLKDDTSTQAVAAKDSLKVSGYVKTTKDDFKHTLGLLKRAGVTEAFNYKF